MLVNDPVRFFLHRRRYNRRHYRADRSKCDHPEILDTLTHRGIYVIERYLDEKSVARIRDDVSAVLFRLRDGEEVPDFETNSYAEYGTYVLHHAEKLSESVRAFLDDKLIFSLVNAVAGGRAVSYGARAELRSEPKENALVDHWHIDTWKFRFKVMLYLTDVTAENAPFRYLAGSHTGITWGFRRFWLDYLAHAMHGESLQERFLAHEASRQGRNAAFEDVLCTGPAGTVILFDTRGLHCGSPLVKPSRMILNHTFTTEK